MSHAERYRLLAHTARKEALDLYVLANKEEKRGNQEHAAIYAIEANELIADAAAYLRVANQYDQHREAC